MCKIPLEDNRELAKKYGIAFGWINLIEEQLKWALLIKSNLTNNVPKVVIDLFDNQMLGQKIMIAENLLDKRIISKLRDLNNKRRVIAHGVTGQTYVTIDNKATPTDNYTISHQGKDISLNDMLDKTIELSKELNKLLHEVR